LDFCQREPIHYNKALQNPKWRTAMESEINSIHHNQTWEIVDKQPHMNL